MPIFQLTTNTLSTATPFAIESDISSTLGRSRASSWSFNHSRYTSDFYSGSSQVVKWCIHSLIEHTDV